MTTGTKRKSKVYVNVVEHFHIKVVCHKQEHSCYCGMMRPIKSWPKWKQRQLVVYV